MRDYLIGYVNILEKQRRGIIISKTEEIIKENIERNGLIHPLVVQLKNTTNKNEAIALIDNYLNEQTNAKKNEDKLKEALQKTYGVDLENIEHMKLQNGLEVLSFYDSKLGRKRMVEYNFAKSLVNEFTDIQNNNVLYQSVDYKKNADNIAQNEASKHQKDELEMVDINIVKSEYYEQIKKIKDQDPKQIQRLNELIKEAERRNIKYINIENMVALDNENNVIETHYDEETNQVSLQTPERIESSVDSVSNVDTLNNEQLSSEETSINPSDFESQEDIKDSEFIAMANESAEIYHMNCTREEFYKNIIKYSKNMSLLEEDYAKNNITKEEYECYSSCCTKYMAIKEKKLDKKKELTLERGFISIFAISILAIILAIVALVYNLIGW